MIMESNDFSSRPGKENASEAGFKKDFVRGVRENNARKKIPDFAAEKYEDEEAIYENAAKEVEMEETVADSIEDNERRSSKGVAWLIGIVAVFAICMGIAAWVGHDDSPVAGHGDRGAAALSSAAGSDNAAAGQGASYYSVTEEVISVDSVEAAVSGAAGSVKNAVASAASNVKSAATKAAGSVSGAVGNAVSKAKAAVGSQSDEDRIEREAREVIQGDYGNNPERKEALGADYAAVQERVNEIIHGVHS